MSWASVPAEFLGHFELRTEHLVPDLPHGKLAPRKPQTGFDPAKPLTPFAGPLVNTIGTWTVGRGFHADKIARDARAIIDEVRISSKALPKDRLLFAEHQE